jgi:hypothetical protein
MRVDDQFGRLVEALKRRGMAALRERMLDWYQRTYDVVPLEGDRRW